MMKKMWTLVKRHHRKGIFTCAVIGGGILLAKYGIGKIQERRQNHLIEYFEHFRRGKHYDTTQQSCNQTVLSLINNLQSTITKLLDSDDIRNILKTNPENKIELWEELKIIAFTRAAIAAYGSAILVLLLRVQFNIIGGFMYLSTVNQGKIDENYMIGSCELQEKFLECVEYFIQTGLIELIDILKSAVKSAVGPIYLNRKLNLADVDKIFKEIREGFENHIKLPFRNLSNYVIPVNNIDSMSDCIRDDLNALYTETSDILGSYEFISVLNQAVNISFSNLSDLMTDFYLKSCNLGGIEFKNPHEMGLPMAKLIPALNNLIYIQCCAKPKHLVENLLQDDMIKTFGANIYDSFSQPAKV